MTSTIYFLSKLSLTYCQATDCHLSKEREDDYSYAYDCSVSPAFIIQWNEGGEQTYAANQDDEDNGKSENIYEEIDKNNEDDYSLGEKDCSSKSVSLHSDSGFGESHRKCSRRLVTKLGTLDVAQRGPYKKRDLNPTPIPACITQPTYQSSLDELLLR